MPRRPESTTDEQARVEDAIEDTFEFVRDVLDSPDVLDHLPERARITLTRKERRDPAIRYAAETRRFVVSVHAEPRRARRAIKPPADAAQAGGIATFRRRPVVRAKHAINGHRFPMNSGDPGHARKRSV